MQLQHSSNATIAVHLNKFERALLFSSPLDPVAIQPTTTTLQQVTGNDAAAVSAAQAADPYGIRIALRPGHPLALLTWQQYIATVTRMSKTIEQQLQGPAVEALAAFNRERKLLVGGSCGCPVCVCLPASLQDCCFLVNGKLLPAACAAQQQQQQCLHCCD
jgi:hypothetical protein